MTATTDTTATIREERTITGRYNIDYKLLIVDSSSHGRLLVAQGYGGGDVEGETYRWRHGTVAQLKAGTTFADLDRDWNDYMPTISAVLQGYDDSQPLLTWSGHQIDKFVGGLTGH